MVINKIIEKIKNILIKRGIDNIDNISYNDNGRILTIEISYKED